LIDMSDKRICELEECTAKHYGHGWCHLHWRRQRRHGTTGAWTPLHRFADLIEPDRSTEDGCWVFQGTRRNDGYGQFGTARRVHVAHRWFYEQVVGPVEPGFELDHLCRNRRCVRIGHLETVSHRENVLRSRRLTPPEHFAARGRSLAAEIDASKALA